MWNSYTCIVLEYGFLNDAILRRSMNFSTQILHAEKPDQKIFKAEHHRLELVFGTALTGNSVGGGRGGGTM